MSTIELATELLKYEEGFDRTPAMCPHEKLTIGHGRNLQDRGLSFTEAVLLIAHRAPRKHKRLRNNTPVFYVELDLRGGVTAQEAEMLLLNDIHEWHSGLVQHDWYRAQSPERQAVLISMAHAMGLSGVLSFPAMIGALRINDHATAAKEIILSKWHRQLRAIAPKAKSVRTERAAEIMKTGIWPNYLRGDK